MRSTFLDLFFFSENIVILLNWGNNSMRGFKIIFHEFPLVKLIWQGLFLNLNYFINIYENIVVLGMQLHQTSIVVEKTDCELISFFDIPFLREPEVIDNVRITLVIFLGVLAALHQMDKESVLLNLDQNIRKMDLILSKFFFIKFKNIITVVDWSSDNR